MHDERKGRNRAVLGVILLAPLAVLYVTQAIWLDSLTRPLGWLPGHLPSVGLFWLLFSGLSLFLYGLTRRAFWAYFPGTVGLVLLAYVSRIKMNINGAPLQLSDFAMAEGVGDIAGYAAAQLIPSRNAILAAVLAVLLLVLLAWRGRSLRPQGGTRVVLVLAALVLLALAWAPGWPIQQAALKLDEDCFDQLERNTQMGVPLGLYAAWCQRLEIDQLDQEAGPLAAEYIADAAAPKEKLPLEGAPDIIYITSESFFDVTRLPGLTFDRDPLPVFHRLSETCTNGRFLSNTYGGGTGWVEMEMLTGLTSSFLKEGDSLSTLPQETYEILPTTVRQLAQVGYATTALHAHNNILYGRDVIYPAIGFQETLFIDDFVTPVEQKGPYASDETFAREIIARYESRDPGVPFFLYGLSMENHQAYTADKFGEPSGYPAQSNALDRADLAILDSLVMGLHDADASLGTLTDYFSQVDRPVMLVFVGDHLPSLNLADGTSIYTRLGVSPTEESADWDAETLADILSTDYLIWTNYETQAQPDRTESSPLLGLHVLERAGIPLNGYFNWMTENLGDRMLLSRNRLFVDAAGVPMYHVPDTARAALDQYAGLERAMVYGGAQRE